ncbi:MAG: hypothetical protein IT393_06985 [Nitrospirae bacterium]|nr:hypothetical protein [Nitrospirota bacterium]
MKNNYTVSGPVDGWCTKCKLELVHTIIAMANNVPVKVKCNTCNSEHKFRAKPSGTTRPKSATSSKSASPARKIKTPEAHYNEYMSRLTDYDLTRVRIYSMSGSYKKDEIIQHSKFGVGIVLSLIQNNKIEMLFKDGPRILIQNAVIQSPP